MSGSISGADAKRVTIDSYNAHIEEYIDKDSSDDARTRAYWPGVQYFLNELTDGQAILEVGSGTGADALRIERQGFTVQRTDITEAFLKHMHVSGHKALYFDILEGPYKKQTAIFANAVFLHFTAEQFQIALNNTLASLTDGGLFCFGMKLGDFEGWREKGLSGKRYFRFWGLDDLQAVLKSAGFKVLHSFTTPNKDFAVLTAKKV